MIKLFTNSEQIRLLNNKATDLDWYYSIHFWKLKLLIRDLLFKTFDPISFMFMQLSSNNWPNNRLVPPNLELDTSLENPGSTAEFCRLDG